VPAALAQAGPASAPGLLAHWPVCAGVSGPAPRAASGAALPVLADWARENGKPHPETGSKVVLTVAHLGAPRPDGTPGDKHDKTDVRDENLAALCQRCHLNFDRDEHKQNAARTRRKKIIASGQLELGL